MSRTEFEKLIRHHVNDEGIKKDLLERVHALYAEMEDTKLHLNLLENAISGDYDSIVITEIDMDEPGPRIVYVNDGFTRMTGYSREEAIGNTPRMLQGPKTDKAVLRILKERLSEGKSFFGHTVNYRKDGSEFINQWDIHPIFDKKGELSYWVSYQHDITERKRSEVTLMDSETEFGDLYEESKRITADVDADGNVISANKLFRDLTGSTVDRLKNVRIWDLFVPQDAERIRRSLGSHAGIPAEGVTMSLLDANGAPVSVNVTSREVHAPDQNVTRFIFENKSAQSRILEALKTRGGSMRSLFEPVSFFDYRLAVGADGSLAVRHMGEDMEKVLGTEAAPLRKQGFEAMIHPEDKPAYRAMLEQAAEGRSGTCQYRLRLPGGREVRVMDYVRLDENGSAVHAEGIAIRGRISTDLSSA